MEKIVGTRNQVVKFGKKGVRKIVPEPIYQPLRKKYLPLAVEAICRNWERFK